MRRVAVATPFALAAALAAVGAKAPESPQPRTLDNGADHVLLDAADVDWDAVAAALLLSARLSLR